MCVNTLNLSIKNFVCKPETSLSKQEKNQRIEEIVKKIREIAFKNGEYKYPNGVCKQDNERLKEVFRFNPRFENKRLPFQLECYFWSVNSEKINKVILRLEGKEYWLYDETANEIATLVFGKSEEAKECLYSLLKGNRFERIKVIKNSPIPNSEFDEWETQKKVYRERIYPACLSFIEKMLPSNSVVVELCGGDGEFARKIFDKMGKTIEKYLLIDLNRPSIEKAEKNLSDQIAQSRAFPICDDVTKVDLEKTLIGKKVDLIFATGGLTEQVLPSKKSALDALENAAKYLKEGGFILLAGLTSSWITSEDLEKLGLEVVNCISYNETFFEVAPEFYIARKPLANEPKKAPLWNFPSPNVCLKQWEWGGH